MKTSLNRRFAIALIVGGLAGVAPALAHAAKPELAGKPNPAVTSVEMFAAIASGDIDVRLIPRDSRGGNVLITNKTDKPLSIRLPEAFAAVPVLAQFGGLGGGGGGMGGMGGGGGMGAGGGMQGMGGGMGGGGMGGGGMGMGGGGMGGGGGFFNVGPEKVGKIKVNTLCLEHGKTEPNPRVTYALKPIETFTDKAEVAELCKMLGRGEIPQNTAQAAAWHLANGMSWDDLARKIRVKHLDGSSEPYFVLDEIRLAVRVASEANRRGQANPLKSPGKQDSLSQTAVSAQ